MAEVRMIMRKFLLAVLLPLCLVACAAQTKDVLNIKREIQIPPEAAPAKVEGVPSAPAVKPPDFVAVREAASPLKTKIIDLTARSTPFQDVLLVITRATGLNLILEQDVNPALPITLDLRNVSVEDSLDKVFSAVPYFYTVKDNMLVVKLTETRIYELGHPPIVQTYGTDVGGDMLGAAMSSTGGGSHLKGSIEQKTESDKTAYNFWDVIEKSIEKILAPPAGTSTGGTPAVQQSVTLNRLTGTIMVTATKRNLQQVESYINTVKKIITRQVVVEAKIIEVTLSDGLKYGIDWTGTLTFNNRQTLQLGTTNMSGVVPASGATFFASTTASDFTSLLHALQSQGEVRTLSNPRLNIMNGQTALLSVGKSVAFISSVQTTQTTTAGSAPTITFTISTGNILSGIMIGIIPHISESGEVSMTITPIVSDLLELTDEKFGTPDSAGNYPYRIQLPSINLRQLSTSVKVRSSEMIVLGGLISKREEVSDDQVPWLGNLPGLGYLFKKRTKAVSNVELVVMLQPVIVSK